MRNPVLVEATRGGVVESFHCGALAVVDASGAVRAQAGDIDRPIFPRSAIKLIQALPLIETGAVDHFGLNDAALALACASHSGEPQHVQVAAEVLARVGLTADALECGAHWPSDPAVQRAMAAQQMVPSALHNNCSGKHAGFVCWGCLLAQTQGQSPEAFLRGYVSPDHPVMREVSQTLAVVTGVDLKPLPVGVDGCSIPTHALPLRALALGFARIATGQGLSPARAQAARRLRAAIASAPQMVAGTGRFDTVVMQALGERLCCKVGAEGVYCAALPDLGLGLALKMDDGNTARAAEVAMAALAQALLRDLSDAQTAVLAGYSEQTLRNWQGVVVGNLRASAGLRAVVAP